MNEIYNEIEQSTKKREEIFRKEISDADVSRQKQANFYYTIDRFPKEFKKNSFKSLDYHFLLIFVLSLFTHISIIVFLMYRIPAKSDSKAISKIQKQYVDLLLDEDEISGSTGFDNLIDSGSSDEADTKSISSISEWMDAFADKTLESLDDMPDYSPGAFREAEEIETRMAETQVPTKESIIDAREDAVKKRIQSRSLLADEVSKVGLLGLISGQKTSLDYEYIDDLLNYADLNADHLANVLSKLNAIQVPHHNTAGYIIRARQQSDYGSNQLKRGRTLLTQDMQEVINDITPIAEAKTTKVDRKVEYKEVPAGTDALNKLKPQYAGTVRLASDVMKVVKGHKPAIQDCYKQALKRDESIHGKIVIRFTVNPEGHVVDVAIVKSSLNSPLMEKCLLNRISKWRDFGYSDPSKGNITYKQLFNFEK